MKYRPVDLKRLNQTKNLFQNKDLKQLLQKRYQEFKKQNNEIQKQTSSTNK